MRKVRNPRTGAWLHSRSIWAWPLVALLLVLCAAPALAQSRITAPGGGGSAIACVGQAAATVLYASSASQCAGDATFTFNDTTKRLSVQNETITSGLTLTGATVTGAPTWSSGQTFPNIILTGVANTALIAASGGSVTGSGTEPFVSLSGTVNTTGVVHLIDANFTLTASNSQSTLLRLRDGATDYFKVDRSGNAEVLGQLTVSDTIQVAPTNNIRWATRAQITSPADSALLLRNAAANNFDRLQFGCTTSSCPSWKRSGAGLIARLADDSADAALTLSTLAVSGAGITNTGVAFASLGTPANGTLLYCTNCDPPAAGATAVCTSAGAQTGALALRLNGGWKCVGA